MRPRRLSVGLVTPCPFMIWDLCPHTPCLGGPVSLTEPVQAPASYRSSLQLSWAHGGCFPTAARE